MVRGRGNWGNRHEKRLHGNFANEEIIICFGRPSEGKISPRSVCVLKVWVLLHLCLLCCVSTVLVLSRPCSPGRRVLNPRRGEMGIATDAPPPSPPPPLLRTWCSHVSACGCWSESRWPGGGGTHKPGAGPPVTERRCPPMTCCCWDWS